MNYCRQRPIAFPLKEKRLFTSGLYTLNGGLVCNICLPTALNAIIGQCETTAICNISIRFFCAVFCCCCGFVFDFGFVSFYRVCYRICTGCFLSDRPNGDLENYKKNKQKTFVYLLYTRRLFLKIDQATNHQSYRSNQYLFNFWPETVGSGQQLNLLGKQRKIPSVCSLFFKIIGLDTTHQNKRKVNFGRFSWQRTVKIDYFCSFIFQQNQQNNHFWVKAP